MAQAVTTIKETNVVQVDVDIDELEICESCYRTKGTTNC